MPLLFNRPSLQNIQFLETSTIYYISSIDLNFFYNQHNQMNTIGRRMAEELCRIMEERSWSLQTESAEQRYKNLLKSDPQILQRVSLEHDYFNSSSIGVYLKFLNVTAPSPKADNPMRSPINPLRTLWCMDDTSAEFSVFIQLFPSRL